MGSNGEGLRYGPHGMGKYCVTVCVGLLVALRKMLDNDSIYYKQPLFIRHLLIWNP